MEAAYTPTLEDVAAAARHTLAGLRALYLLTVYGQGYEPFSYAQEDRFIRAEMAKAEWALYRYPDEPVPPSPLTVPPQ